MRRVMGRRVTPLCPELVQPGQAHSPQIRFAYPRPSERVYSPPHRSPHYRGAPTKRRGGRGGWGDGRITPGPAFGSRGGGAGGEAHRASPQSGQHTVHLPSRLTVPKIPPRQSAGRLAQHHFLGGARRSPSVDPCCPRQAIPRAPRRVGRSVSRLAERALSGSIGQSTNNPLRLADGRAPVAAAVPETMNSTGSQYFRPLPAKIANRHQCFDPRHNPSVNASCQAPPLGIATGDRHGRVCFGQ